MQWLKTNIRERLYDHSADFKVEYELDQNDPIEFDVGVRSFTKHVSDKRSKIYIGLSGGLDSEFICNSFIEQNITFSPLIIDTPANQLELKFAYHFCRVNKLEPIVINKSEKELVEIFYEEIHKKINGVGRNSVAGLIGAKYALENDAVFVRGEQCIEEEYIGFSEWDMYNQALVEPDSTVYFFLEDQSLCRAFAREYKQIGYKGEQDFKYNLYTQMYEMPFRPKIYWQYSDETNNIFNKINMSRKHKPNAKFRFGKNFP